jgi:hypothetical protein
MAIKVIKQPDIHLTASELARYRYEYEQCFRMYCGSRPDFEEWVAEQERAKKSLALPRLGRERRIP